MLDRSAMILLPLLALPFLACLAITLLVPGIEMSLLTEGLKIGVALVVGALALSYAASVLASRSERR